MHSHTHVQRTGMRSANSSFAAFFLPGLVASERRCHNENAIFHRQTGSYQAVAALQHKTHSHHRHRTDDNIIARDLFARKRVFCWITTLSENHEKRARVIKATWAKRCNRFVFISDRDDPSLPAIDIKVKRGRDHLWQKTKSAIRHLYKHHLREFDFFFKADDDTYAIIENLRHLVEHVDPEKPYFMGRRFKPYVEQGYMSGGAGYVFSRRALQLVVERALNVAKSGCHQGHSGAEDVNIGQCMQAAGVPILDSRDANHQERFHPLDMITMVMDKQMRQVAWMYQYAYYPLKTGYECCSDYSITFHYMSPENIYMIEFLLYHLRPYGIISGWTSIPRAKQLHFNTASIAVSPDHVAFQLFDLETTQRERHSKKRNSTL